MPGISSSNLQARDHFLKQAIGKNYAFSKS